MYSEHIDLFPTLAEAAALIYLPPCPYGDASFGVALCTEGSSLVPLMKDPTRAVCARAMGCHHGMPSVPAVGPTASRAGEGCVVLAVPPRVPGEPGRGWAGPLQRRRRPVRSAARRLSPLAALRRCAVLPPHNPERRLRRRGSPSTSQCIMTDAESKGAPRGPLTISKRSAARRGTRPNLTGVGWDGSFSLSESLVPLL